MGCPHQVCRSICVKNKEYREPLTRSVLVQERSRSIFNRSIHVYPTRLGRSIAGIKKKGESIPRAWAQSVSADRPPRRGISSRESSRPARVTPRSPAPGLQPPAPGSVPRGPAHLATRTAAWSDCPASLDHRRSILVRFCQFRSLVLTAILTDTNQYQ
jgi:hypothetical protein